jgi:hypothetical protein
MKLLFLVLALAVFGVSGDGRSATLGTPRNGQTTYVAPPEAHWNWKKLNPIWWAQNDDDQPPPGYTPLTWFLRNPFHNFFFYVVGFADEPVAQWPAWSPDANFPPSGCAFQWVQPEFGLAHLFVSCSGRVHLYAGWRHDGAFGIALRH